MKKKNSWILSAAVMLVLSVAVAYFSGMVYAAEAGKLDDPVEVSFTIDKTEEADISTTSAADFNVISVQNAYDASGSLVAYIVESSAIGYNAEAPIVISSVISADGTLLAYIDVLEQHETEYFGDRIMTDSFIERFDGRWLPVILTGETGKGAHVDALSKATISTKAVLEAINNAHAFVNAEFVAA